MAKRENPIPQDFQAMNDYERDLKIVELRRTVELLQRQLEQQQNNAQPRRNQREARGEVEDKSPFGFDDYSSDEDHINRSQRRLPRAHDGDVKVEVLEFDRRMQGDAFLDWLYTVERIFEFKEFLEERKVKLVAIKLKGYASLWWENLKMERNREGRRPIQTWEKMKHELKKRFLSENNRQYNYVKFYNFKQYNLPMEENIREFEHLMLRCDINEMEEQTIRLKRELADTNQAATILDFH